MAFSEQLDSKRNELAALERNVAQQQQASQRERRLELDALASSKEDHLRNVDGALTARNNVLKEMKAVRSKIQDKLLSARAKGNQSVATADRALARAGRHALDAKLEADRWQARAAEEEKQQRRVMTVEEEHLTRMRKLMDVRVADAQKRDAEYLAHGQRTVEDTDYTFEQIRQSHAQQSAAYAAHAENSAALHEAAARTKRHQSGYDVKKAMDANKRERLAGIEDMQKSRDVAAEKITAAQLDLRTQQHICQDRLDIQKICAAQGRKIADTLGEQSEEDRQAELAKLQVKMEFAASQAQRKVANFGEEIEIAVKRNEAWDGKANHTGELAKARADDECAKANARVDEAKITLENLQATYAAYIRSIMDQWAESQNVDNAKLQLAQERTNALKRYCQETIDACRKQWEEKLSAVEWTAKKRQDALEGKVAEMDDLSKQRVAMVQSHSQEWRVQAESHLAAMKSNVEEVRTRLQERVMADAEAAHEKVRLARDRQAQRSELAARRTSEAEARRDKALAEYTAVMARIQGAAQEARRRGLDNIADIIEPRTGTQNALFLGPTAPVPEDEERQQALDAKAAFTNEAGATSSTAVPEGATSGSIQEGIHDF